MGKNIKESASGSVSRIALRMIALSLIAVILVMSVSCSSADDNSDVASRVYSVDPWSFGTNVYLMYADVDKGGKLLSINRCDYKLVPEKNGSIMTVDYDMFGRITQVNSFFGLMNVVKYDIKGRAVRAENQANVLTISYNKDGGSSWSFQPIDPSNKTGLYTNEWNITFDKYWRCVGGQNSLEKLEIVSNENEIKWKNYFTGECIITYTDNCNIKNFKYGMQDPIEYKVDEMGKCISVEFGAQKIVYAYDERLNQVSVKDYRNGQLKIETNTEFDDLNRETEKQILQYSYGVEIQKQIKITEYIGENIIPKQETETLYSEGIKCSIESKEYYLNGEKKETEQTDFWENGNIKSHYVQTFNKAGYIIGAEEKVYSENGVLRYRIEYKYTDGVLTDTEKTWYDENGNVTDQPIE